MVYAVGTEGFVACIYEKKRTGNGRNHRVYAALTEWNVFHITKEEAEKLVALMVYVCDREFVEIERVSSYYIT